MLFDTGNIRTMVLHDDLFSNKQVSVHVLRLDEIHPVVSGNKLFKLHYFLEEAAGSVHKTILTFGGVWSNHLPATAFACQSAGLKSIGIIRGEETSSNNPTLSLAKENGMELSSCF